MASTSALFLAFVGVLGQLATRELFVFPALFLRYLVSTLVILSVLRGDALQTGRNIGKLDWLRVGSVLISQFCLFYYLNRGPLLIGITSRSWQRRFSTGFSTGRRRIQKRCWVAL
jgi:hypothetical protein